MEYASINNVYQIVKRLGAKNEQGFFTLSDYNTFAPNAQQRLFQSVLNEYRMFLANRRRYLSYSENNYNSLEAIKDDLRPLQRNRVQLTSSASNNIYELPNDYAYFIDVEVEGNPVTVVDISKRSYYNRVFDGAPSASYPIGIFDDRRIEIIPSPLDGSEKISYYKVPQGTSPSTGNAVQSQPTFAYTVVNGKEVFNASNSVNFEFPKHMEYRLASIILMDLGIEIREQLLMEAASVQEQQNKTEA